MRACEGTLGLLTEDHVGDGTKCGGHRGGDRGISSSEVVLLRGERVGRARIEAVPTNPPARYKTRARTIKPSRDKLTCAAAFLCAEWAAR